MTWSMLPLPPVGIALVGPGLVGRLVLEQFASSTLRSHFRIISISNSRYTIFDDQSGAASGENSPERLLEALLASTRQATAPSGKATEKSIAELAPAELVDALAQRAKQSESHIILVDCTASDALPKVYAKALLAGLSVVTPNKVAPAGSQRLYQPIAEAQQSAGAGLFYCEGACGAGLPVLSTLADLVRTGDEIIKIEAVLSGTLSYIFNQFSTVQGPRAGGPAPRFSEIVRSAHRDGHTEPHPAEDLSGRDVARKLTILARFSEPFTTPAAAPATGLALSLADGAASVSTQSLIPEELVKVRDPNEFVDGLAQHDAHFARLRSEAQAAGKVLRYAGVLDTQSGRIECALQQFSPDHPFASLSGSHLSLAIFTERYKDRPLVIQGPGYPVEVTASAVIADAIRVAERYGHSFGL